MTGLDALPYALLASAVAFALVTGWLVLRAAFR